MSKHPVKTTKHAIRTSENDAIEVIPPSAVAPFSSFRYSFTEISVRGDKTHVNSRKTRFENGKLTSEAFEGDLDRTAYDSMITQVQRYALGHAELLVRSLAFWLPSSRRRNVDGD